MNDEPHSTPRLSAIEVLTAVPPLRRAPQIDFFIKRLQFAIDGTTLEPAYEILAAFGEIERTRNGYKAVDPRTLTDRARRLIKTLESAR